MHNVGENDMNEYYAMGKIISQPQFNFLFNEKRVSIISFWMQLKVMCQILMDTLKWQMKFIVILNKIILL